MHWFPSGGSLRRTPERIGIRFRFLLLIITAIWQRSSRNTLLEIVEREEEPTVGAGHLLELTAATTAVAATFTMAQGSPAPSLMSSPPLAIGGPSSTMVSLKSLLQGPVKSPERRGTKDLGSCVIKDKERKMEDDLSVSRPGHCAYLGSLLWERTLPYNEIEYVDLDEFLLENGLPPSPAHQSYSPGSQPTASPSSGVVVDLSRPASCASSSSVCSSSGEGLVGSDYDQNCSKTGPITPVSRSTPSPVDPEAVEVLMNFDPDPADLALSSIPGHETFDPRKHRFSEEELKPQPIMKKARKIQVPDDQKDEKYWNRRYKNNEAAKRSRDARRLKENQITVRAAFLEKENAVLRQEVANIRQELTRYRSILSKYESQHGTL
ncbi:D site-binding protein isoform X1 [Ahaetulla prasina]|uniref:D site-binding protein isoform X1 n=2 Tax=Ahaetulla prasina TaxID=499056 RepID=UPI00264995BC|nr:D site-binding protein isoform X1 [Ahaetulla prasina]